MKYIISALIASLFLSSCVNTDSTLKPKERKEIRKTAIKAIKLLGKTLKINLKKSIKQGGIENGATFCSFKASDISKEVNKKIQKRFKKDITIKRISLKNRRKNNYPKNSDEIKMLKQFQKSKSKKPEIVKVGENHYKVYSPIYTQKKCLVCHGTNKTRNKQAYNIIKKKYPMDKAINYKKGDFRGAFLVNIIK